MMPGMLVFPVHAATIRESRLLAWLLREKQLLQEIRLLAERLQTEVVVCTSEPLVESYCRDNGFACRLMPFDAADDPQPAFAGLSATAEFIRRNHSGCAPESVLFVNWRNAAGVAGLAQELQLALEGAAGQGLASVVAADDHPVQFLRLYDFLALELFVRVDDEYPSFLCRKCTRPFTIGMGEMGSEDWDDATVLELPGLDSGILRPAKTSVERRTALAEQGRLYLRSGPVGLRRVVPLAQSAAGYVPAFSDPASDRVKLLLGPQGWTLRLCAELALAQPEVQVLGLRPGVAEPLPCGSPCADSQDGPLSFHGSGALERFDALVALVYCAASGTDVDFARPFEILNDYWRLEGGSGEYLNVQTGNPIHGRQDFPPLFEQDFSLLAVPFARLNGLRRMLQEKDGIPSGFKAFRFSKKHSLWHAQRVWQLQFMANVAAERSE